MWKIIQDKSLILINSLIYFPDNKTGKILNKILIIVIFLFGLFLWIRFFNFGTIPSDRLDWLDITFPRLTILQQAVVEGELPLHIAQATGLKGVTNRYFSIPDLILTPDLLTLRFFSIETSILIHILLMYSIGFLGLLDFRKRYKISLLVFLFLFLVFNFNGHIVSHLAIGHLTWTSYFLLPFFISAILELSQNKNVSWGWVSKICFIQLFIYLAGGYHLFVWCLLFIGFILLTDKQNKKWIFLAIVFSILINSYRIFPSSLLVKLLPIDFMAGFPTTDKFFSSLISVSTLADAYSVPDKVNVLVWEFDFYIGLIGLLLILVFSGVSFWQNEKNSFRNLMVPILLMIVLSIGNFYKPIFDTGIPLISGERISSRFFIIPLLFLFFISALNMQKLLNENKNKFSFALLIMIILLANDLTQHLANWELSTLIRDFPPENVSGNLVIGTMHDPIYLGLSLSGSLITVLVLIFLGIKIFQSINKDTIHN